LLCERIEKRLTGRGTRPAPLAGGPSSARATLAACSSGKHLRVALATRTRISGLRALTSQDLGEYEIAVLGMSAFRIQLLDLLVQTLDRLLVANNALR
jgi:hypothetical protein